jgi:hypothetical protein
MERASGSLLLTSPAGARPAATTAHQRSVVRLVVAALGGLVVLIVVALWMNRSPSAGAVLSTPYQAVYLTSGQVFMGRLEGFPGPYPVLRDSYYFQTQINPDTKQPQASLIRRGKEWHAPQVMVLNATHILFVESVAPDSRVGKLIEDFRVRDPQQ